MGWLTTLGAGVGTYFGGPIGAAIGGAAGGAIEGADKKKKQEERNRYLAEANRYAPLTNRSFNMDPVTASAGNGLLEGGMQGMMLGNSLTQMGMPTYNPSAANVASAQTGLNITESTPLGGAVSPSTMGNGMAPTMQNPSWLNAQQMQMNPMGYGNTTYA